MTNFADLAGVLTPHILRNTHPHRDTHPHTYTTTSDGPFARCLDKLHAVAADAVRQHELQGARGDAERAEHPHGGQV